MRLCRGNPREYSVPPNYGGNVAQLVDDPVAALSLCAYDLALGQKPAALAMIKVKRIYESPSAQDGLRVLVDRIWPRGVSRTTAAIDVWMQEIAPSSALRKWFGHDPAKWEAFYARYARELDTKAADEVAFLKSQGKKRRVTLLHGAKDTVCNNAVALKRYLESH